MTRRDLLDLWHGREHRGWGDCAERYGNDPRHWIGWLHATEGELDRLEALLCLCHCDRCMAAGHNNIWREQWEMFWADIASIKLNLSGFYGVYGTREPERTDR